jgi:hypothetical protein
MSDSDKKKRIVDISDYVTKGLMKHEEHAKRNDTTKKEKKK